ncbi:MAG: hypothetical protein M1825_000651 [Sarcosagium campestre]|nr:MAG: hypothetical protein M1825_000651 [Sarcosagium campestre]
MHCATCSRPPSAKLGFNCPTCARSAVYELRYQHVAVLLQKEQLGREVEDTTGANNTGRSSAWSFVQSRDRAEQSRLAAQQLREHSELVRQEIGSCKADLSHLKASLAKRRADLASAARSHSTRLAPALEHVERSIKRTTHRWDQLHQRTAEARVFLCREAASLYGLRQRRRRRNGVVKDEYFIGGISVIDLRDLNNATPSHISTSLNHIAHLLILITHYLSLQLPAEITLPHRDYPLPTVFLPASSYTARPVRFPGSTSSAHSASSAPALPRPRPLYIDKPLPVLAKEDPAAYALFIEGATLLAWDIAWVCRAQQASGPTLSTWEDVCALGRNLHQLLVVGPDAKVANAATITGPPPSRTSPSASPAPPPPPPSSLSGITTGGLGLGHYSHGSAHTSLLSAAGIEHMRAWRLASPVKIGDKLKAALLGDMAGAEWEVLEEAAWHDPNDKTTPHENSDTTTGTGQENESARIRAANGAAKTDSLLEMQQQQQQQQRTRSTGANGWMKLKPR